MSHLEDLIAEYCPDGVLTDSLGNLGYFFGGLTGKTKEDFQNGNANYISYLNVFNNPSVNIQSTDYVKIKSSEKQNTIQYGDIIFTGSSETAEECGMSSVMTTIPEKPFFLNSFSIGYRLFEPEILIPDFSKHLFRSFNLRKQINKTASGVTRFNVSKKKLAQVVIPIPPIIVQQEIVRILDKMTYLEAELEAELEARILQYEHYRTNLLDFNSDTPNPIRTPHLTHLLQTLCPDGVEHFELEKVITSLKTGLNPRKNFQLNTPDANNYYVTVRELSDNKVRFFDKTDKVNDKALELINKRSNLERNDILFSGTGTVGRTALVESEPMNWDIKEGVYVIKPKPELIQPKFLLYILNSTHVIKNYEKYIVGSPVISLPMSDLRRQLIPVPPLPIQEEIVAILDRFESLVSDLKDGLPAEIAARHKQYEHYRNQLLTFKPLN